MKKIFLICTLLFSLIFYGQNETKITTKKCLPKKGFHLRLKTVFDDSRCPEGVTCIWAGEVSATIEVYNNKQFVEEKALVFNAKNKEENFKWLEHYFQKKIKSIGVFPYPKEGQVVKPKKQYITIVFED